MGLRKSHVKKADPTVHNSGLFGIIDKVESTDQMRSSEVISPVALNFKAQRSVRDAMLEAEYRKAQAIALTSHMRFM